jgi:hypothetical protein
MERKTTSAKFITIMSSICLVAFVFQHFAIYKILIMPKLPSVDSIPLLWWAGYMLPIFFVAILAGFWSKNLKEISIISSLVAVIINLFVFILARFNESPYFKAYEGAFLPNFLMGTLIYFVILIILLSIGRGASRLLVRSRNK